MPFLTCIISLCSPPHLLYYLACNFGCILAAYIESLRSDALDCVSEIELIAVQDVDLPFRIPRRYNA